MEIQKEKIRELVNNIGSFIEFWGFRKIHGKVWCQIYLSQRPLSSPEIVEQLGVSKALISGALNDLLMYKLVERIGKAKYGGITYIACPNPAEVVRDVIKNRELVLFTKIQNNLLAINQKSAKDSKKLNLNTQAIKNLKILTDYHKKTAQKLCKKNIKTMEDWISYIKRVSRFAF
jgi:DNA-binding transcriptional regulator GbsR (MarR family)